MRFIALIATLALTPLAAASAATAPKLPASSPHNPAIKDSSAVVTRNVAGGANSYTRAQAEGRIVKAGVDHVQNLAKDPHGVWRGSAMRGAHRVSVALDYKGHVTVR